MEAEFIQWLRRRVSTRPQVRLGPGDDAAILCLAGQGECVVTTDLVTDGVDFDLGSTDPRRIGRKSLAVNLSDLAAMAAQPMAAIISLALPREGALELAKELYEGLLPLADSYELAIAGGDTNTWDGRLVISVAAIGHLIARGPLLRSGARPGDHILVTGSLGGSILGHHLDFEPRVREALYLHEHYDLTAGMDISDGLALDLSRLARESGCGALLELEKIPISAAAHQLANQEADSETALQHALGDGEDFELLLAAPAGVAEQIVNQQPLDIPITCVGRFVEQPGLWKLSTSGEYDALEPRGYEH